MSTPQQYACPQTLAEVPARWPAHWTDFVVKPLSGSTANGVNIIRSGVNVWTGQRVRVLHPNRTVLGHSLLRLYTFITYRLRYEAATTWHSRVTTPARRRVSVTQC